jgi:hypothetical protein
MSYWKMKHTYVMNPIANLGNICFHRVEPAGKIFQKTLCRSDLKGFGDQSCLDLFSFCALEYQSKSAIKERLKPKT